MLTSPGLVVFKSLAICLLGKISTFLLHLSNDSLKFFAHCQESDKRRIMWNKTQIAKNSGQIANLSTHQNRLNSLNNVKSNAQNTQDMANQVKMVNKDVRNITKKIDVKSIMKNAIKLEKSNLELEIMDDMMNFGTVIFIFNH